MNICRNNLYTIWTSILHGLKKLFIPAREPEFDYIRDGLIQASGGTHVKTGKKWKWVPRNGAGNGEKTNLAHVYPYNAMKSVVEDALDKWPDPTSPTIDHDAPARLLAFLDWIFKIDLQAVVNSDFHDDPRGQISHSGIFCANF